MGVATLLYRFVIANLLTLVYSILALIVYLFFYLIKFGDPSALKIKLEPPSCLSNPKYGAHKYIKVNNIKLHYVESGNPDKPLMIFVHGFPEFWYSWRHQILEFQKDYWCVAIDMRGYGDSERPDGVSSYKIDLIVDDIRDLVRQLGREKCILVSHEWGGVVACRFRDVYPEALSAIVVLAAMSIESWGNEIWSNRGQLLKSWYVFLFRMPWLPEKMIQMNDLKAFDKIFLEIGQDKTEKQDVDCYKYWFGKQHTLTAPLNYYRANFPYVVPEKKFCEKNIPFLHAMAERDSALSLSLLDSMKKEYKHIESVVLKECRHFVQQENPEYVNELIRGFLNKHKV